MEQQRIITDEQRKIYRSEVKGGLREQISTISEFAKKNISDFVNNTLREKKLVTKAFTKRIDFASNIDSNLSTLATIIMREFKRRNPHLKDCYDLGIKVTKRGIYIYTVLDRVTLERYANRLRDRLQNMLKSSADSRSSVSVETENYFFTSEGYRITVNALRINLDYIARASRTIGTGIRPLNVRPNYAVMLLYTEDILSMLRSISKYSVQNLKVLNNTGAIPSVYINKRLARKWDEQFKCK